MKLDECGDVISVRQLSQVLLINKDAAYALVHSGAIAYFMVGRSIRIPKIAVLRLLGMEVPPAPYPTTLAAGFVDNGNAPRVRARGATMGGGRDERPTPD